MAEFDVNKLNEAYQKAAGQDKSDVQESNRRASETLGRREVDMDDIADTFCQAWPVAMGFFNWAFMFARWVPGLGSMAVMAKGVITAIDQTVVPMVCKTGATPVAGSNTDRSRR